MPTYANYFQTNNPYLPGGGGGSTQPKSPGGSSYNSNPPAQGGTYNQTFGGIPGPISMPNPFQDLSGVYPNLGGTNQQLSGDIYGQLSGQLSPATLNAIQNAAASWGVGTGMPNSPLSLNKGLSNVAGFAENQVNQGIQNYNKTIPTVSGTQTVSPTLQAEIAARNAAVNAAPNPTSAATYAQSLFDKYLQQLRGPGGGTGQGVGSTAGSGTSGSGSGALGFGFGTLGAYDPGQAMGGDAVLGTTPDQASQINDLFNSTELGGDGTGSYDEFALGNFP